MVEDASALIIPIERLETETDAAHIERQLSALAGVKKQKVEWHNRRALIWTDEEELLPRAVQAIRDLGYRAVTQTNHWPVLHMSCASCASSAQQILAHQPGVAAAAVNYANGEAQVEYFPGMTTPQQLKSALQDIGYDLNLDTSEAGRDLQEENQQRIIKTRQRNMTGALLLALPTVILGMFFMEWSYSNYLQWALATPVLFLFGNQFFVNAWKQAKHRSANMDTLVALSTGVAYLFSVFNTLRPEFWRARGLQAHVYFEAATVVIAFVLLGKWLEERAKGKTSNAIKKLMGLQPKTATVIVGQQPIEKQISKIEKGDLLLVKPGERIAVDGQVTSGHSYVDESMISGEAIPVEKTIGARVFAGTINQKGSLQFSAEKVGGETLLAHIIRMVQLAQGSQAPVQRVVDRVSRIFVPVVLGIAVVTFVAWVLVGGENGVTHGLLAMVSVLVVACPCALGLATPTAIMAGIGKGAENGILIKDADSLERATTVNAVVLDKTGTITEGRPTVTDVQWWREVPDVIGAWVSLEQRSAHPLAEAIVRHFGNTPTLPVDDFQSFTGLGVGGTVAGRRYLAGNEKLLAMHGVTRGDGLQAVAKQWLHEAKTVVWLANPDGALAVLAISDPIKATSRQAVRELQEAGVDVYMLTGDNTTTAAAIARQTGITHVKSDAMPGDKAAFVRALQQQGKIVGMAGDGINDSEALARADVSIAMGRGSDIAMEVAKITIVSSELTKIGQAIALSRMTVATIRQNLFWAFIYNLIGIPLAAGVLFPVNGFMLNPMVASAAMALSSVSVVSNSLRLRQRKLA